MAFTRTPYFLVPLVLDVILLGAILAGPLRQPGVPVVWMVLMALSAPWVVALLLRRRAARRHDDRNTSDTDFI